MIAKIDIKVARDLYSCITKNKYSFSDDLHQYNKITAIMERMIESIEMLNSIKLEGEIGRSTKDAMMWIFYADLFLACINELEKLFPINRMQKNNIFASLHGISGKNDNDYLRFIRAIIMPHALSLDDDEQKKFTQGKTAFCPHMFWGLNNEIIVCYYIDDISNHNNYIHIPINLLIDYVEDLSKNIRLFIPAVKKQKGNKKGKILNKLSNEKYDITAPIQDKIQRIYEILNAYGDVDDKKKVSYRCEILDQATRIATFKFDKINKKTIQKYFVYLNKSLDDLFSKIVKDKDGECAIDEVISPTLIYSNNEYSDEFDACGYEINKIVHENVTFGEITEKCFFPDWLEKIKPAIKKYVHIKRTMGMMEICYLTIISMFFENLDKDEKVKDKIRGLGL